MKEMSWKRIVKKEKKKKKTKNKKQKTKTKNDIPVKKLNII
jgi:hypothetical protein